MDIKELKEEIFRYAKEVGQQELLEVLDVEIYPGGKGLTLRIIIDKEGGVTIKDCENFSRALEAILDIEDPIKSSYTLEVSSPGIDKPLHEKKDFLRNMGRNIKITTKEKIGGQTFFIGKIIDVGEDWVRISILEQKTKGSKKKAEDKFIYIPFNKILKAQIYLG
jgi:ribosome maturation factor RimP